MDVRSRLLCVLWTHVDRYNIAVCCKDSSVWDISMIDSLLLAYSETLWTNCLTNKVFFSNSCFKTVVATFMYRFPPALSGKKAPNPMKCYGRSSSGSLDTRALTFRSAPATSLISFLRVVLFIYHYKIELFAKENYWWITYNDPYLSFYLVP